METVTSQCEEGRHDLCSGHYGDRKGNYSCECICHKKKTEKWEDSILSPEDICLEVDAFNMSDSLAMAEGTERPDINDFGRIIAVRQAKAAWEARQPDIDRLRQEYQELVSAYDGIVDLAMKAGRDARQPEIDQLKSEVRACYKAVRIDDQARQEGRRDVVEWLEEHRDIFGDLPITYEFLQEQKQKWGIK